MAADELVSAHLALMVVAVATLVVYVVLESFFLNPGGLVFLAFLVPLLLLYLIKPKPQRKTIPSLMFILKDTGKNRINRLFRNWLNDLLLLLHLLALLFLLASIAQPYINVPRELLVSDTILVIDVSASTKADNRWDDIQDAAIDNLADTNTLILAQGFPEMITESAPAAQAKRLIRDLKPKDTTTNLADALKLANQYAGPNTNVVIISDFLPSEGSLELEQQLDAIKSKGAITIPIIIGEPTPNVGIIDIAVRDQESKVWVKNFNDRPAEVTLAIGEAEQQVLLAKRETKEVGFATPEGVTEITIKDDDAFMTDNTAWLSTPTDNQIDMLVITNDRASMENSKELLAFQLIQKNFPVTINIEYAVPPKVPELNHDVYMFHKVNPEFLLPGVIKKLQERVEDGAALIIKGQNNLFGVDFRGMLPVALTNADDALGTTAEVIAAAQNPLTRDISFGQVQTYFKVSAKDGVTTVAQAGDAPIVTLSKLGKGTIVYYGYFPGKESFSVDNSFPIFWRRLLDLVTNRPSLQNLNVDTGTILSFPKEQKIKTPTSKLTTNLLRVEDAGLYVLPDRTIAANLVSDLESNINREPAIEREASGDAEEEERKVPKEIARIILTIGVVLLFLELLYIKFRGDL